MALSVDFGNGLLVLTDDDNDGEHTNYKILPWSDVVTALDLPGGTGRDPTARAEAATAVVRPSVETDPVASYGDAADDAAIWVHPDNPELSIVIGSQKQRGINVYDLDGSLIQSRADGRINNVDVTLWLQPRRQLGRHRHRQQPNERFDQYLRHRPRTPVR